LKINFVQLMDEDSWKIYINKDIYTYENKDINLCFLMMDIFLNVRGYNKKKKKKKKKKGFIFLELIMMITQINMF